MSGAAAAAGEMAGAVFGGGGLAGKALITGAVSEAMGFVGGTSGTGG